MTSKLTILHCLYWVTCSSALYIVCASVPCECPRKHTLCARSTQELSKTINSSEEAKLISQTAKTMLEALQQCIDQMKDCQLTGHTTTTPSPSVSLEASPQHLAPPILQKKAEAASAAASLGQHVVSPATAVAVSSSSSETRLAF